MHHLNHRQILEWMAYAKLFPFGDERADYRSALQTFWTRSAWIDEAGQPTDYMPQFENAGPRSEAQMIADDILKNL